MMDGDHRAPAIVVDGDRDLGPATRQGGWWPAHAQVATMVARPPSDVRRLYFSTWQDEEIEAIMVRGPRGFQQRILRDFQGEGPYVWLSMPGLQCNDTVSYEYDGRFDHREMPQVLHAHPLLKLDPPEATWRYPITLHVGGGAAIELDRPVPFLTVGARFGGPFGDVVRKLPFLVWRSSGGTRLVWQLGAELQLTYWSYDQLTGTGPPGTEVRSVAYQRQMLWWGSDIPGAGRPRRSCARSRRTAG